MAAPGSGATPRADHRFIRTRRTVFAIVLASFVLSLFHRAAPAAIANELAQAFSIGGALPAGTTFAWFALRG